MTKAELTELVFATSRLSKKESSSTVDTVFELMKGALISGDNLKISGFGGFSLKVKSARKGRNPQSGEAITISNRRVVTFKPSGTLRQVINDNSNG